MIREATARPSPGRGILLAGQPVRFTGATVRPWSIAHGLLEVDGAYTVASSQYYLGAVRVRLHERPGFQFLRTMFEART